ncbi:protein NETWORKED 3A-like [Ananas comosus]|uniref:Protein NETWORKED 3A-like n=1 Tax=Ananas comosus TaxID=4615 RepID=A0A6P5EV43_ANACO|nr:protein NETWORKED 3A-like [Ananas comosus]
MMTRTDLPQAWWFDRRSSSKQSPWLLSALSGLEEKTKQMLELIEGDADSFAQRAEAYYKKRPLLVDMIREFYRAHRALAEQYDQLKSAGSTHHNLFGPSFLDGSLSPKVCNNATDGSSLFSSECSESEEPDVDDTETEAETDRVSPNKRYEENERELQVLREQNAALKAELDVKDEEKREVIRQLAFAIDILKEENADLRKHVNGSRKMSKYLRIRKVD